MTWRQRDPLHLATGGSDVKFGVDEQVARKAWHEAVLAHFLAGAGSRAGSVTALGLWKCEELTRLLAVNALHGGDYMARGIYGQYIYVNPARQVVIALNSADRGFDAAGVTDENLAMLRLLAETSR